MNDITPIYEYTFAEARKNGERDVSLYRASHKANIDCARAIDKAVSDNFDGMRLNRNAADGVIADYGIDRVMVILAHTLNEKNYDGRFSRTNKEWAKTIRLPNCITMDNAGDHYYLNAHPAVLDGFVDIVRERCAELKKPSIKAQLADAAKNAPTGKRNKVKKDEIDL